MNDTIATLDDKIAMIMAVGVAKNEEEASWALSESGGDIEQAIALLGNNKIPLRKASDDTASHQRRTKHVDDDGIDKPPWQPCVDSSRVKGK